MTKQEFLVISNLLVKHGFDELDRLEFVMCFERETKSIIPDEWIAEASLSKPEERTDWSSFRREAAKDILCAITVNGIMVGNDAHYKLMAQEAIKQADELIKQLKEGKK